MTKLKLTIKDIVVAVLLVLTCVAFGMSYSSSMSPSDIERQACRTEKLLNRRMQKLDSYMREAATTPCGTWLKLEGLPEDMVVYLYDTDTLESWCNSFSSLGDDISNKYLLQVLADPTYSYNTPLSSVDSTAELVNLGPRWYLCKAITREGHKVVGGLEIVNTKSFFSKSGVNRRLQTGSSFAVRPLSVTGGEPVYIGGKPVFKIVNESLSGSVAMNPIMIWITILLAIFTGMALLSAHPSKKLLCAVLLFLQAIIISFYLWGRGVGLDANLFSPTLYADGKLFYSLGGVLLLNLLISVSVACVFITRRELFGGTDSPQGTRRRNTVVLLLLAVALLLVAYYIYVSLRSLVLNSSINLELYRLTENSPVTFIVYVSYLVLILTLPVLVYLMRPAAVCIFGRSLDPFSLTSRAVFSAVASAGLLALTASLDFQKEKSKVEILASRLSVSRDISLEMLLRSAELPLASDEVIANLVNIHGTDAMVQSRIASNYLFRIPQGYAVRTFIVGGAGILPEKAQFLAWRMLEGEPIAPGSAFRCNDNLGGRANYTGLFNYPTPDGQGAQVVVCVDPKNTLEDRGYVSVLDFDTAPGKVVVPNQYSYAKYEDGSLVAFKGDFPYPTIFPESGFDAMSSSPDFSDDGWMHFSTEVSDQEILVMSRRLVSLGGVLVVWSILTLLLYFLCTALSLARSSRPKREQLTFFRKRISLLITLSLTLTLLALASISIFFVFKTNEDNLNKMMLQKIGSVQALIEERSRWARTTADFNSSEASSMLENVSNIAKTDIALYSPQGRIIRSTSPEIFERNILGVRMDGNAYEEIVISHRRLCVERHRIGPNSFFALYAPLAGPDGNLIAIVCAPYTDEYYDFETSATSHLATIIAVFLLLLLITRFFAGTIVDRMLKPLVEMSAKMKSVGKDGLEQIEYHRDDEIASLVAAYNRMVVDLNNSSVKLAQAERDKAWSAMARQIAHEIKNPLTPMKLQIQRIIRLKQRNAPDWQEKFDEVAKVVLYHIDVLSDIANEFLLFAKVDSEEKVEVNLDELIKEEVSMYEHRDDISISYIGFAGAVVKAPKPQISRVLINLINNATQAIENSRREAVERGEQPAPGQIYVSLRQSADNLAYEIVIEDNGPGVSAENQEKLFTSSFTTKDGGTGIGLTMSHSILEKCGATITYSRSFQLGGASFLIRYPKGDINQD